MPIIIDSSDKVVGSVLYEDPTTADLNLNFYSATLDEDDIELDFSQQPTPQSWTVDYPMLAYKTSSPDDREIALVHLSQDMP